MTRLSTSWTSYSPASDWFTDDRVTKLWPVRPGEICWGDGALLRTVFSLSTFLVWEQGPSTERAEPGELQGSRQHQMSLCMAFRSPTS